jgi:glycosyltransferase
MKVSIITATFNSERSLQKTIDSVISQDYKNIEHIVVDGGSTDNTLNIISANQATISNYISENDKGIYDALNKGIKLSTGDIIGFLNSDDILADKNVVSRIVQTFLTHKTDVVYGDLLYVSNSEGGIAIRFWKSNEFNHRQLKFGWMPPHPTVYCRRKVYEQYGGYDETYKISGDYDYILRIFKEVDVIKSYLPITMVKMEVGGVSNNSVSNIFQKSVEDFTALRKNNVGSVFTIFCKYARKIFQFMALIPISNK